MLFYFTATGNSLYVAKKFDENPISIPQIIHKDDLTFEDETIGIVCPVFGHLPPQMVQEFMQKASFKTNYFYMILTYGNRHGGAAELTNQIAKKFGLEIAYIHTIVMVDNFLPVFDMNEQRAIDKKVDEQIAVALADVAARRHEIPAATELDRQQHAEFVERNSKIPASAFTDMYQVTDACIGCGICVKVCPAACFRVENGRAVRSGEHCQVCMACAHHCPHKAIKLLMAEKNPNARYRNEHVSLQEIIEANNIEVTIKQ